MWGEVGKGKTGMPWIMHEGFFQIADFNSSHYQFEDEPFAQFFGPGLLRRPGRVVSFLKASHHEAVIA